MRSGFSVWAKAWRCQAVLPKKLRRSRICSCKLATLLRFATSVANSSTSPERMGPAASGAAGAADAFAGFARDAGEVSGTELPREAAVVEAEAPPYRGTTARPRAQ